MAAPEAQAERGFWLAQAEQLAALGAAADQQADWETALTYFEQVLAFDRRLADPDRLGLTLWYIGLLHEKCRRSALAVCYLDESLVWMRQTNSPYQAQVQRLLQRATRRAACG
jgi:tetratricopeptide (TPR) repeat protein